MNARYFVYQLQAFPAKGCMYRIFVWILDLELESEGASVNLAHQTVRKNISLKLKPKTEGKPKKKERKKSEKKATSEGTIIIIIIIIII